MPGEVRTARRVFLVHFAVVAVLTAVFALLAASSAPEDGANIGAGVVGLPLLGLGLPWSIPAILIGDAFPGLAKTVGVAVAIGPAYVNVALHGVAVAVVDRGGLTDKALRRLLWMGLLVFALLMMVVSVGAETTVQRLLSGAGAFFAVVAAACVRALMRESELPPRAYLDAFFDTGRERTRGARADE